MSYVEHFEDARDVFYIEQSSQTDIEPDITYNKIKEIGPVIEHSNDHFLVRIININKLIEYISIWSKAVEDENGIVCNRNKNKAKINEIYTAIINNTLASSIISVSDFQSSDGLRSRLMCWDGQHRYWALRKYYNIHKQQYNGHIYLMIYRKDKIKYMTIRFKNINMGSSAQATYVSLSVKQIADRLTQYIKKKFSALNTSANKPRSPNYNIEQVHSNIVNMFEEIGPQFHTNKIITNSIKFIDIINDEFKLKYENDFSVKVMAPWYIKARQYNCFLFCESTFIEKLKNKIIE